jgi:hypothetical protein
MSTRHSLPSDIEKRPFIARTIRWLSVPIILGWLALTVVTNVVAPQLEEVGAAPRWCGDYRNANFLSAPGLFGSQGPRFDATGAVVM